jgi:hypothetical protein
MDIVEWLQWNAKEQGSRFAETANEIERLRRALQLIADHPVAKTNKWETGAKEMQALAVRTLEGKG